MSIEAHENAARHNYHTTDNCDTCNRDRYGTMLHAPNGAGQPTPVLFLCWQHYHIPGYCPACEAVSQPEHIAAGQCENCGQRLPAAPVAN